MVVDYSDAPAIMSLLVMAEATDLVLYMGTCIVVLVNITA
jgi:hypothetical protein